MPQALSDLARVSEPAAHQDAALLSERHPRQLLSPTIVIIGGVAGGASAPSRARQMNEQVEIILFAKDKHVSFANCGLPYHIRD